MLHILRRLARPFSVLALVALLAPAHVAASREMTGHSDASMPCCMMNEDGSTGIKADCCAIQQQDSNSSSRPAGTMPGARHTDGKVAAHAPVAMHVALPEPVTIRVVEAPEAGPPSERLYLRLSVIRR